MVRCLALMMGVTLLMGCPDEASPPEEQELVIPEPEATPPDAGPPDAALVECAWPADCPGGDCIDGECVTEPPPRCERRGECGEDDRCPDGQTCVDSFCRDVCPDGETCGGRSNSSWCQRPCDVDRSCPRRPRPCATHRDCPVAMRCLGEEGARRCVNACITDEDCPSDGWCYEGECVPFPDIFDGAPAAPLAPEGRIYAGVGVVPLSYPLGVSMAGFGARAGPRNPYAFALGGSDRVFERQDVRVIALSTDEDLAILLRLPLCWSTDYLITRTALKVQAATGVDYSSKIITFGTHSHSHPGRFWNLAPEAGLGFAGFGTFSREMTERYSDSFAEAIIAALEDLRPARVGWHLNPAFDPERRIHSNRRSEFPHFTDDRMLVMRVEDHQGRPMAALVNLAIHGTHMNETWVTGDVAGGIEVVATERLSALAGRHVPVLFANGMAGNISPRGDDGTRVNWGKMQVIGHRVWPILKAGWDSAAPEVDPHLEVVQRRIPVDYDRLGYDRSVPEFRHAGRALEYGGFQCAGMSRGLDEEPHVDGMLGCIFDLITLRGVPTVQAHKSVLSAFRLGDLVVTTLPGEPSSQLGEELTQFIKEDAAELGEGSIEVAHFGYANDHHLYLVLEDDWFRGGYEAGQSLWGWKLGRYFLESSQALARQLFTVEKESNATNVKPTIWPDLVDDTVIPTEGESPNVLVQPPEQLRRGAMMELRWVGGHPGADQPNVALDFDAGGGFGPAYRNGLPFDHRGFETLTFYLGDFDGRHVWAVRWELPWDMPLGRYRVAIEGAHRVGSTDAPYRLESRSFVLRPAQLVAREVVLADGRLAAKINYPDGPSNDDGEAPFEQLEIAGHWLRLDPEARWDGPLKDWSFLLGPAVPVGGLSATVNGAPTAVDGARDSLDRPLVVGRAADGSERTQNLQGWETTRVELDARPGTVARIEDAWGNVALITAE